MGKRNALRIHWSSGPRSRSREARTSGGVSRHERRHRRRRSLRRARLHEHREPPALLEQRRRSNALPELRRGLYGGRRMTGVRRTPEGGTRSFIGSALQRYGSKTERPLTEPNGPQKPGRWHAPRARRSPIASAPRDLAFAPSTSNRYVSRGVIRRQSGHNAGMHEQPAPRVHGVQSDGTSRIAQEPPHALQCYHASRFASMLAFCLGGGLCD